MEDGKLDSVFNVVILADVLKRILQTLIQPASLSHAYLCVDKSCPK